MVRTSLAAAALAVLAVATVPAPAAAQGLVKIGLLRCQIVGGTGFIVGSSRDLDCRYEAPNGRPVEFYAGTINRLGIDIGVVRSTDLVWAVLAPTNRIGPGALAGRYGGVSAEATLGVGLGANALLGGFQGSIALNPLSVQAQTGANIAAGVAGLKLDYVRPARG
jgi:hypothetical protein